MKTTAFILIQHQKILVIDKDEGFFHPHMAAHQWKVRKVSRARRRLQDHRIGRSFGATHQRLYGRCVRLTLLVR